LDKEKEKSCLCQGKCDEHSRPDGGKKKCEKCVNVNKDKKK